MRAWAVVFNNPVQYAKALHIQHRLLQARQDDRIPDTVLILQHFPVVTIGNRGRENYLLKTAEEYKALGIELYQTERGGDVTYHAPGQWVLYPILHLAKSDSDSHSYLHNLEEIALRTLNDFGVKGFRREGKSGAWTDKGKVAAIGFRLKKWVTFHGMSFNVKNDQHGFETIVPCGLVGEPVSSLLHILEAQCPTMDAVCNSLLFHFSSVCKRDLTIYQSAGEADIPAELKDILESIPPKN